MKQARPFLISGAITGVVMAVISVFIDDPEQANGTLFAGLIAGVTIAAIPIYDIDGWSLTKRSVVHFLAMGGTVFPLLLLSDWFSTPVAIAVFLLFGAIGWSIGYLAHRLKIRQRP